MSCTHLPPSPTSLYALLQDPKRQQDLEYFKSRIAEIDALADWGNFLDRLPGRPSAEEKAATLASIEQRVLKEASQNYLLQHLLRFIRYVKGDDDLSYPHPQQDIRDILESLSHSKLLTDEKFRSDAYGSRVGYGDVTPITDELELVMQSAKKAEKDLYDLIRLACSEEVQVPAKLSRLIEDHELAVNHHYNALIKKVFSTQSHAAMYYEDAVRERSQDVVRTCTQVQEMLKGEFSQDCAVIRAVRAFLLAEKQPRDTRVSLLYDAVLSVRGPTLPAVVEQTIAMQGKNLLRFNDDEIRITKRVFMREQMWNQELQTYLMVGFLRNLHFADMYHQDYEFEATWYILKSDPQYQSGFEACIKRSTLFKALHDAYSKGRESDMEAIKKINGILQRTYVVPPKDTPAEALHDELTIRLYTLENELLTLNENGRSRWISDEVKRFREVNKRLLTFSKDEQTTVCQQFYTELYKTFSPLARANGEREIKRLLSLPDFALGSITGFVRTMLLRWRLDTFLETHDVNFDNLTVRDVKNAFRSKKLLSTEEQLLAVVFTDYLNTPEGARFWPYLYDFGSMELATKNYRDFGTQTTRIIEARGDKGSTWDKVLDYYHDFRDVAHRLHIAASRRKAEDLYMGAYECEKNKPNPFAHALILEMKQFLDATRFTHSKVPVTL